MSAHEKLNELLVDFVLGELPQKQSSEVKSHVDECRECRNELKRLEALVECTSRMSKLSADEQMCISARDRVFTVVSGEEKSKTVAWPNTGQAFRWRILMKNPVVKIAIAAAVILVCLAGLYLWTGTKSGVALADVLEKVEQAQAFMYKMKTKTTGNVQQGMPSGPIEPVEITGTVLVSTEYGMKMDMDMNMVVNGASQKTRQLMYMLPQEKKAYVIVPEQKQYIQMEFSDDLFARMKKQSNDPREFLRQIINSKYADIGKSVIDGVEVEGFETTDPACLGGMAEDVKVTLWVDRKTELPVREEIYSKMSEQMQMEGELYDFQWYVQVNADEFNPVIPQDYTNPLPNYKMPTVSEEGAIEGLRFCEQMMGRYPQKIDWMNLMSHMNEIVGIKDSNNPAAAALKLKEVLKLKEDLKGEMDKLPKEEKTKKIMEMTMEIMRPVQSLGMFYMTLVQDKKEPAYYGESVTPADTDKVLLRWKTSDNEYRVIFGDLRAETVTAEKLAELEAALPK
jgi:outer membrane lipoprotein-sorting protein